ncbi:hypothetical protein VKT23_015147 [Stygiomarasmius scandens]|uniref:Uncharacterized protein n=1 Tax=Marasmiellus scandens TaxID=2682957 RepID=A0ABR1J207_9AGAR
MMITAINSRAYIIAFSKQGKQACAAMALEPVGTTKENRKLREQRRRVLRSASVKLRGMAVGGDGASAGAVIVVGRESRIE